MLFECESSTMSENLLKSKYFEEGTILSQKCIKNGKEIVPDKLNTKRHASKGVVNI